MNNWYYLSIEISNSEVENIYFITRKAAEQNESDFVFDMDGLYLSEINDTLDSGTNLTNWDVLKISLVSIENAIINSTTINRATFDNMSITESPGKIIYDLYLSLI